jgi:hypothetical protein
LKPAVITHRSGVFDRHADALYYLSNFRFLGNTPIHYDVLDVTKLEILFRERWPYIEQIFVSEAAEWIRSMIGKVAFTAVNEYMCHEGGHAVGFAVSEKLTSGFFRLGGRLRWPLIYMEEFRADTNSWFIASRILKVNEAVAVIIYTLIHRFGLAGQNLIEGSPGAGYVPYLHFYSLLKAGALLVKEDNSGLRLAFAKLDPSALLEAALIACRTVDDEINRFELNRNHEESADASLAFATARLGEDQSAKAFRQLFAMRPQR